VGRVALVDGFVDCHSHVLPSGDDGAQSVRDSIELCRAAAAAGTRVLVATPHVWPHLPVTRERETAIRAAFDAVAPKVPLELRLGFELTPAPALLREDLRRYALEGTELVLVEVPFRGPADILFEVCERMESQGLSPVVAHPERTEAVQADPRIARDLAALGWRLQVNASSLTGDHGEVAEELGWDFLASRIARVVASDGHRTTRPARVDRAWTLAESRLGADTAGPAFDGTALGIAPSEHRHTAAA
jgi:protein-tyrosine phosphatase